jgi:hypothetical protein
MKDGLESEPAGYRSAVWGDLRAEHFDGHTEFTRMSQEQRLAWLSELAMFIHSVREWRAARDRKGNLAA